MQSLASCVIKGWLPGKTVLRRVRQMLHGRGGQCFGTVGNPRRPLLGHRADHVAGYVPLVENGANFRHVLRRGYQQHPLLRLRQHHLVAGHSRLAAMHPVNVQYETTSAASDGFHRRAGEAGRAQILQRADFACGQGLQARFNQRLFQKGIAHLHRGAQLLLFLKGAGRQPGRAVNPVPSGAGAHQKQRVAGGVRRRAGQVVNAGDADAHRVDQRILRIGFVKVDFAGYVGNADAVAVPADAVHDAAQQPAVGRVVRRPEAQRVQQRNRPRAHSQYIPHDAADAGGCALQRLHRRRVVVGFDLEHHGQAVADVDCAGVFRAGLRQGALGRGGQHPQQRAGVLVAAVFAPQRAEHTQLNRVRFPVQPGDNHIVLSGRKGDFVEDFFGDGHNYSALFPVSGGIASIGLRESSAISMTSSASCTTSLATLCWLGVAMTILAP